MRRSARHSLTVLGLGDPVIEINLTPNRPDCTGVNGIARDLGATLIGDYKENTPKPVKGTFPCPVAVNRSKTPELCPAFGLRLVQRRQERPLARMAAEAAHRYRPAADQRAGRYHQLHHLRPRPSAARVRCRQGQWQSHRPARQKRRDAAGARRQNLHARPGRSASSLTKRASNRSPASWAARRRAARNQPPMC